MAAALSIPTAKATTHIVTVTFEVPITAEPHIQTPESVTHEMLTWLQFMGADVQHIAVRAA